MDPVCHHVFHCHQLIQDQTEAAHDGHLAKKKKKEGEKLNEMLNQIVARGSHPCVCWSATTPGEVQFCCLRPPWICNSGAHYNTHTRTHTHTHTHTHHGSEAKWKLLCEQYKYILSAGDYRPHLPEVLSHSVKGPFYQFIQINHFTIHFVSSIFPGSLCFFFFILFFYWCHSKCQDLRTHWSEIIQSTVTDRRVYFLWE